MQDSGQIPVVDGKAQFSLPATSYTTVVGQTIDFGSRPHP
jgi:hypothetical protein